MYSQDSSAVTFQLGVNDRYNPESWSTTRTVSSMYVHDDYYYTVYWENDIALFKLSVQKNFIFLDDFLKSI